VFWFCLQTLSGIFLILRRIQRNIVSAFFYCQILMKLEYYRQIFEIFSADFRNIIGRFSKYYRQIFEIYSADFRNILGRFSKYYRQIFEILSADFRNILGRFSKYTRQIFEILSADFRNILGRFSKYSRQIFEIFTTTKFHENLTYESQVVPRCVLADGQAERQTDMTKPIFAFRNFTKSL
jgi:phage-related protein